MQEGIVKVCVTFMRWVLGFLVVGGLIAAAVNAVELHWAKAAIGLVWIAGLSTVCFLIGGPPKLPPLRRPPRDEVDAPRS